MQTLILKTNQGIEKAVEALKKGEVIIYPTETSYGIGCDITNKKALKKARKIKGRKKTNFTAIVPNIKTAKKYGILKRRDAVFAKKYMPGKVTLVVKKRKTVPKEFDEKEFAFRISSNKTARAIAEKFGKPVLATSANISGEPAIFDIKEIKKIFLGKVELILDAGKLRKRSPTAVVDLYNGLNVRRGKLKYLKN